MEQSRRSANWERWRAEQDRWSGWGRSGGWEGRESGSPVPTYCELLEGTPECCLPLAWSWGLDAQPRAASM